VVDVLGGDGLVRRVAGSLGLSDVAVLTCDLSPYMVRAAWSADCPALLQKADHLLQRDSSVDGVLVAYGSHHIAPEDRATLARESYRVLRPGGVLVLHDFLVGSPMGEWFDQVVDQYSETGHQFEHFTREEMLGYLATAGFESFEVVDLADPYVATAATPVEAELGLGRYLLDMYGLVEIDRLHDGQAARWAIERARTIFRYPREHGEVGQLSVRYDDDAEAWRCTVPRMAIVGVGRKAG
jgi:SAM-dependent methyltransferase